MFKLLILAAHLTGTPAFVVDVGLTYDSEAACEADAPRAMGMLNLIFENRNDGNDLRAAAHLCQRAV